ncbi:Yae1-N domain-containing protein [Favolaschia claudopus]|uniref:Protein YAE1 n=1 Tax=Favolaschia claudopus TaxID=2862362 RepID=A0AAW0DUU2_9AGAR
MESPWDETATSETATENEWAKISSDFTNAGYREGITAGKESALQEGFDSGFATVGAPLGRDIGFLRGMASALTAILQSNVCDHPEKDALLSEARDIAANLAVVRYTDVVPRDLEAEAHAREHLQEDDPMDENEELSEKRKMEGLEDMLSRLTAGAHNADAAQKSRPTMDDVRLLEGRLHALSARLGINVDRS